MIAAGKSGGHKAVSKQSDIYHSTESQKIQSRSDLKKNQKPHLGHQAQRRAQSITTNTWFQLWRSVEEGEGGWSRMEKDPEAGKLL